MPTVEEDVQYLIQIVKKDMEIKERRKLTESVPVRVKAIDKELKKMDEDLNETKHVLDTLEQEKRHIEMDLKTQHSELAKKKDEQRQVKDNKEYRAILAEIDYITKRVDQEEERMLAILDEGEARRKEMQILNDKITVEKNKLLAEKEKLQQEMQMASDGLKILEDEKIRIMPRISEGVRRLYSRVLVAKGDSGVANLVGDICYGCYSRVPPQKAHEVRQNNQILKCEVCGRILVHYEVT
jgi:predicted  nucleic acid-binding Zn-ribbon protein